MSGKVITFGEIMMRLNPENHSRFVQADRFEVSFAGGEANVAVALANLGVDTAYVSKLPSHELGQSAVNALRKYGVDTRFIRRGGDRVGIYFVEKGASQRPSKVIYDRASSAIALADPDDFDWDTIFEDARWFHFTGITPALGGYLPAICKTACQAAKDHGVPISCDLNYRKKLWSKEEAGRCMSTLMPFVNACIANEEDAADVFGIAAKNTQIQSGVISPDGYVGVARQLTERFGFDKVAITLRGSLSASVNNWAGMLYEKGEALFSPQYQIQIVDRVGGGDSFGAALIYAQLTGMPNQEAINFAVAASCLKHSIEHDFNLVSLEEIQAVARGDQSGRVQR